MRKMVRQELRLRIDNLWEAFFKRFGDTRVEFLPLAAQQTYCRQRPARAHA